MKKNIIILIAISVLLISCKTKDNSDKENKMETIEIDYSTQSFDDLFKKVAVKDFNENIFNLIEKAAILTSGTSENYNSMAIGWGAFGIYFQKPATFLSIRANRYTLEFIKSSKTYTITCFDTTYFDQILHFGNASGRNTDKMGTHRLHSTLTPTGNPAYKEANIIIECNLMEITTVSPDDFYFDEGKKFINDAFIEAKDYHKIVAGEITNIWVKK
ncbi:MAG: flavin reductase family protein [Bacteroidales bacterium]|nr:flavin reductase family protein [Bacteroidales bacterium]